MKYFGEWKITGYNEIDYNNMKQTGLSSLVSALLCSRSIVSPAHAKELLRDDLELLNDPYLMIDMDKAVKRIKKAIERKEKVVVYGDYDVDGITSACLMTDYLRKKGLYCISYIPERLTEGYGISDEALHSIKENDDITLMITVDCGITALSQIELAKELGMDSVITDHHKCPETLPACEAVVNPHREDCKYPFKGLAGVGVAFKLICALEGPDQTRRLLEEYGDLIAIGTIADIMPVRNENRAIIRYGIDVLGRSNRLGLRKLIENSSASGKTITPADVSFTIIPKLNAAGRMGNVRLAYELLMTDNEIDAAKFINELNTLNQERREIEKEIYHQAVEIVKSEGVFDKPLVLASEKWHHGVSGIVASRLADTYGVPAIVICMEGEEGRGSCRSYGLYNIFDALDSSKEHLTSFGGHSLAAGLTIKKNNIDDFKAAIYEYFQTHKGKTGKPDLCIDFEVKDLHMLSLNEVEALSVMTPWGNGNPPPLLCATDMHIDSLVPIGCNKHLKLKISKNGQSLECVFFSMTTEKLKLKAGSWADFAFEPVVNEFRGNRSTQLILRDARPSLNGLKREKHICRSFFSGNGLSESEKQHILPKRKDFAGVWRYIRSNPELLSGSTDDIIYKIAFNACIYNIGKTYVCLKVFDELGLIKLNENCGTMEIKFLKRSNKVDLNRSRVILKLRG